MVDALIVDGVWVVTEVVIVYPGVLFMVSVYRVGSMSTVLTVCIVEV